MRERVLDRAEEVLAIVRDDADGGPRGPSLAALLRRERAREGDAAEAHAVALAAQRARQLLELGDERRRVGRLDDDELVGPVGGAEHGGGEVALVLLHDRVEVRAAEAERAHARAPRLGPGEPGLRLVEQDHRGVVGSERLDRGVHARVGRQDAVLQREDRLEQADQPGGAPGVAQQRLHRSDRAALRRHARGAEEARDRLELGAIADGRAGAVRLVHPERGRVDARPLVRPLEREPLAGGLGRGEPHPLAVARAGDSLDDRIDAVAVALRVREPLQDQHADALADHDAVGLPIEDARAASRREGPRLAERQVPVRGLLELDGADDHGVRPAGDELLDGEVERGERGAARRVDDQVGAPQVELVGDPPRDDVHEDAGVALLRPPGQPLQARLQRAAHAQREQAARHVRLLQVGRAAGREDHGGVLAVEAPRGVPRVRERAPGDLERQELRHADRPQRRGRDPVAQRIERELVDEAAPLRVDPVLGPRVGVVVQAVVPALPGDLADRLDLAEDVPPELARRLRPGQQARRADHGDARGRRRAAGYVLHRGLDEAVERAPAARGHVLVQRRDRDDARAQGRDVAHHVQAARRLPRVVDRGELPLLAAVEALGRDPQPAERHLLEACPPR
ncbi:hypothetical protein WMF41_30275 [Sorangium sp. So ce1151]